MTHNQRTTTQYPEHEKMLTIKDKSEAIGEFLEWMGEQGIRRMKWATMPDHAECFTLFGHVVEDCQKCDENGFVEVTREGFFDEGRSITQLLADYFEIDLNAIEAEKRDMIESLRAN